MYCFGLTSLNSPFYCNQLPAPEIGMWVDLANPHSLSSSSGVQSGYTIQMNPMGLDLRTSIVTTKKKNLIFMEGAKLQKWESKAARKNPIPRDMNKTNTGEGTADM